jgi:hypothetical protein
MNELRVFETLPGVDQNTYATTGSDVDEFLEHTAKLNRLPQDIVAICRRGLELVEQRYGSADQPPEQVEEWLPYHNLTHSAAVMAVGAALARADGQKPRVVQAAAVAGAFHDTVQNQYCLGENEIYSADEAVGELKEIGRTDLQAMVVSAIHGTFVKPSVSEQRIAQNADTIIGSTTGAIGYVADADLAYFGSNRFVATALSLWVEQQPNALEPQQGDWVVSASAFMGQSAQRVRKHKYLSNSGTKYLKPFLTANANQARRLADPGALAEYLQAER